MKLSVSLSAVGLSLALLAGCGDDDSATDSGQSSAPGTAVDAGVQTDLTTTPSAGPSSSASTAAETTASATTDDVSPSSVAAELADSGLGCDDFEDAVDDPEEVAITLAPEPEGDEGTCTIDGIPADILVLADEGAAEMARAQIETVYRQFMVAFGIEEIAWTIAGPDERVWISASTGEEEIQPAPTEQELAMLDEVAEALDGEVFTFRP